MTIFGVTRLIVRDFILVYLDKYTSSPLQRLEKQHLSVLSISCSDSYDLTSSHLNETSVFDSNPVLLSFTRYFDSDEFLDVGGPEGEDLERSEGVLNGVGEDLSGEREEKISWSFLLTSLRQDLRRKESIGGERRKR